MREKYFEDLGLDDGQDILSKFKINMDEILEESKEHEDKKQKDDDEKLKTLLMNQLICCLGIIHERQSKSWQSCTKRVKNIEKMH